MRKFFYVAVLSVVLSNTTGAAQPTESGAVDVSTSSTATKQTKKQGPKKDDLQIPMSCDGAATDLDVAVVITKRSADNYLIMIARPGTGESNRLSQIRLASAEEYVLRRGSDFKYVLAVGERTPGLGRLELYVEGRLYSLMPYVKNAKSHCPPGREGW